MKAIRRRIRLKECSISFKTDQMETVEEAVEMFGAGQVVKICNEHLWRMHAASAMDLLQSKITGEAANELIVGNG